MINKAEQSLEDDLVSRIADIEKELRQLKAATQPIAASSLAMELIPADGPLLQDTGPNPAGGTSVLGVGLTNAAGQLTLFNWFFDIYIDAHDEAHRYLAHANVLTADQMKFAFTWWVDATDSFESGLQAIRLKIKNEGTATHTYYIDVRAIAPKMLGETTAS